jgi:hypothetical protein
MVVPAAAAAVCAGVPAPLDIKASGTFELTVDEEGKKVAWSTSYALSHTSCPCLLLLLLLLLLLAAGEPAPLDTKASGTYELTVDEEGKKAAWALKLCDVPQYVASHLHSVGAF